MRSYDKKCYLSVKRRAATAPKSATRSLLKSIYSLASWFFDPAHSNRFVITAFVGNHVTVIKRFSLRPAETLRAKRIRCAGLTQLSKEKLFTLNAVTEHEINIISMFAMLSIIETGAKLHGNIVDTQRWFHVFIMKSKQSRSSHLDALLIQRFDSMDERSNIWF